MFGKMTVQGELRYEATTYTATADKPPSSVSDRKNVSWRGLDRDLYS